MENRSARFHCRALSGLILVSCLTRLSTPLAALPSSDDQLTCGYENATFTSFVLPVFPRDPRSEGNRTDVVFDLLVSPTGELTAKAATYAPSRDFVTPGYRALDQSRFAAALECDEPASGMIRHTMGDCFFPSSPDPSGEVVPPEPLWALDRGLIQQLDTICRMFGGGNDILIEFRINADGQIAQFIGKTDLGKALIKHFFEPLKSNLPFKPATRSGEPTTSRLTLRLASTYRSHYLDKPGKVESKLSPMPRNPNTGQSSGDGQVTATVEFKTSGEIASVRVDGNTPPALATAVIAAVREWTYMPDRSTEVPANAIITCKFGFISGSEEAVLLDDPEEVTLVMPNPTKRIAPTYPIHLKQAGLSGRTESIFIVDKRGRVRDVSILNSTHQGFSEAARQALLKWRFEPGMRNGEPIAFRMMIPMKFNLNQQ